jgi:N-acetylneuraminic acid mutarotase
VSRATVGAAVVNGKIYAIGGWRGSGPLSVVEEYDPVTDTWTSKTDMPTARGYLSASVVNEKIYVIGGKSSVGAVKIGLPIVEEYDPATDTWAERKDMPTARRYLSTSVVNDKIYAIGGLIGGQPATHSATAEEYDPATDTWTKKTDMPTARGMLCAGVVDGKIYAIGGISGGVYLPIVEEYTPTGWKPTSPVSMQGKLPTKWGEVKSD